MKCWEQEIRERSRLRFKRLDLLPVKLPEENIHIVKKLLPVEFEGAEKALKIQGSSLLPIGVKKIEGEFQRGSLVACISPKGEEIAHGLINYDSEDCLIFLGKKTSEIKRLLLHGETLIHRDNLVLI